MDNSWLDTLPKKVPNRSWILRIGLIVLTCTVLFVLLGTFSHPEFGTWESDQTEDDPAPEYPPSFGESWPGRHPHSRPDSTDIDSKADVGTPSLVDDNIDLPPSYYSKHHHTVNGFEVSPPPPPADEDEYVALCKSKRSNPHTGRCIHLPTWVRPHGEGCLPRAA